LIIIIQASYPEINLEENMTKIFAEEIRHSVFVRAPAERVFDAFTVAAELDNWFTNGVQINARPGGTIYFRWQDWGAERRTNVDDGIVLEAKKPTRFVFQWHPDNPSYATTVEIDIEKVPTGSTVRVREFGFLENASGLRAMLDSAANWGEALTWLKIYLDRDLRR
jgi:uncharacterized protein YndB with AHSA1/START domain